MEDAELSFCYNCATIYPANHPTHHTRTTFITFAYKKVSPNLLSYVNLLSISNLSSTATIMVCLVKLFENFIIKQQVLSNPLAKQIHFHFDESRFLSGKSKKMHHHSTMWQFSQFKELNSMFNIILLAHHMLLHVECSPEQQYHEITIIWSNMRQ